MSNEIIVPNAQQYDENILKGIVNSAEYFPRIGLFGSNSDACKEGKIGVGRYGLTVKKDEIIDLGNSVDAVLFIWRPLAMRIDGKQIITTMDSSSNTWKDIQNMADNGPPMNGNLYGVDFLTYIPKAEKFGTFFCSSRSQRKVANQIIRGGFLQKPLNLGCSLVDNGKHKWHVSTFQEVPAFALPDISVINENIEKFNNLKNSGPELAPESNESSERR